MLSLVQEVVCWTRAGPSDNMCDCLDKIMIRNHMTNLLKKLTLPKLRILYSSQSVFLMSRCTYMPLV